LIFNDLRFAHLRVGAPCQSGHDQEMVCYEIELLDLILPNTTLKSKEINTFGYRHNYHVCLVNSSSILFMDNIQFCPQNDVIEDVGTQPILSVNKQKRFVWNKI
jgi:hypothetical protein